MVVRREVDEDHAGRMRVCRKYSLSFAQGFGKGRKIIREMQESMQEESVVCVT